MSEGMEHRTDERLATLRLLAEEAAGDFVASSGDGTLLGLSRETLIAFLDALVEARAEVAEWEQTNALMRRREAPWIARWQQETGKLDTLPDYGEMLAWLVKQADDAEAHGRTLLEVVEAVKWWLSEKVPSEMVKAQAVLRAAYDRLAAGK